MMTISLIIFYKFIFIFTCVLSDKIQPNGLNKKDLNQLLNYKPLDLDRLLDKKLNRSLLSSSIRSNLLPKISSFKLSKSSSKLFFKSFPFTSINNKPFSKRIKRENQLLINNELATGLNHDSNYFSAQCLDTGVKQSTLADGERHLSSDIELPEYSEEEDEDIEDDGNAEKDEKDADYEEEEISEGEKNRKKNKKVNKNRVPKKKDKTSNDTATPIRKPSKDYTNNYIELISGPGNITRKTGEKAILRCSFEASPRPKIKWLRNEAPLDKTLTNKYQIKEKRLSVNKFSIRLIISQLDTHDTAFYKCKATNSHNHKAEGVGILKVRSTDNNGISSNSLVDQHTGTGLDLIGSGLSVDGTGLDNAILPSGDSTFHMTQDAGSEMPFFQDYPRFSESNILDTDHNQQLHNAHSLDSLTLTNTYQCVPYKGTVCSQYLRNNHTVIVQRQSQYQLEELLHRAFRIIANAANISPQCHRFTMPLLCFQSFHVCEQNDFSPSSFSTLTDHAISSSLASGNVQNRMQQMQADHAHPFSTNSAAYSSHYTSNSKQTSSFSLKQLCRDECEILEHDICSMEFTLAKINPVAGLKSLLPNCEKLPRVGTAQHENCLRIGVTQDFYTPLTNHKCYLDKGETYRGSVNRTISGKTCEIWSAISPPNQNHPELSGSHNFCRNPRGAMSGPWCHVRSENQQYYKELCDVPKCDDHFWIYYILTPLLAILTLSVLIGSIYCTRNCQRRKPSMDGICLSANEIFSQQLHQQHFLQSNVNSLNPNNSTLATPLRTTLPVVYGRQSTNFNNQNSISTASSKQSDQSLLSNVLNTVSNPGRVLGNAISQSMKNNTNIKLESQLLNNLELKALLPSNDSSTTVASHYALSNIFSSNNINITGNPISNSLIHYPLHCIRILTRIYPRNNQLENTNSDDAPSNHLKSSLNYQFYAGQLSISSQNTKPVIIRALKLTNDQQNVTLFAEQAAQLSQLSHENIIKMVGVAIGANNSSIPQHFVIFEQYSPVNLVHFLQQQPLPNNSSSFNNSNVEYIDLLQFAYQISNGMNYLAENGYVHGDLACRNCYINNSSPSSGEHSRFRLKIGGLRLQNLTCQNSRRLMENDKKRNIKNQELKEEIIEELIDDQDYYSLDANLKAFPVRWLPPETLISKEYSTMSDVWSMGVCLYEIMSFCRQIPFQTFNNVQVIELIKAGRLLECPPYCEPSFYALMLECWRELPNQRCSFAELVQKLIQLIKNVQSSSHNNGCWFPNLNRNNRVCSPMPLTSQNKTSFKQITYGEDKVNGWLLNSNEFSGSANYLSNNNKNVALKTNTINSSSTYASSYCNNQSSSPNYNYNNQKNSTTNNTNQQVEYDQPFAQVNDLEANQKLLNPPQKVSLSTFQPTSKQSRNVFELKNNHLINYNSKLENNTKHDDYYENHYSKLTYENEELNQ